MSVKYGPRKVGQAAYELNKLNVAAKSKFGLRKFGRRKASAMAAEIAVAESVVEEEKQPKTVVPARVAGELPTTTSIKQIDEALLENHALYEELFALELERADGPRKGALRIFMREEMALEGGPRDERMAELEDLVKPAS